MLKMNDLNHICFICLNGHISLKTVLQNGTQNDTALQVRYILPEITIWDSVYICSFCCTSLNSFYMFKKRCLENYNRLMNKNEFQINIFDSEPLVKQEKDIELTEELIIKDDSADLVKKSDQKTFVKANNAEVVISNECFLQPEFIKCEIESDSEPNGSSSVSEYKNTFDSQEIHTDNENCSQTRNSSSSKLLPEKSKARYERHYQVFVEWCTEKKYNNFTENVLLAYFMDLVSQNRKSLWLIYAMLKSCIIINKNIDISKYPKLIGYLKGQTANMKPKKSRVLEEEHIDSFINQAPDREFLMMKVVIIIGVSGALRTEELCKMAVNDVQLKNDIVIITLPQTKPIVGRQFVIANPKWVAIIQKYVEIRLTVSKIKDRFFLQYQKGRCVNSPVGINTIGSIPSKIANFINLANCKEYTGHCFRRSSAAMLAKRGGDPLALKRHGCWKSVTVVQGYIENSLKRKIVSQMISEKGDGPSTSKKANTETHLHTISI